MEEIRVGVGSGVGVVRRQLDEGEGDGLVAEGLGDPAIAGESVGATGAALGVEEDNPAAPGEVRAGVDVRQEMEGAAGPGQGFEEDESAVAEQVAAIGDSGGGVGGDGKSQREAERNGGGESDGKAKARPARWLDVAEAPAYGEEGGDGGGVEQEGQPWVDVESAEAAAGGEALEALDEGDAGECQKTRQGGQPGQARPKAREQPEGQEDFGFDEGQEDAARGKKARTGDGFGGQAMGFETGGREQKGGEG